jgi:hypothetical protein
MNIEHLTRCVKCGAPIQQPATGRPRTYCSTGCRRAAEKEITRVAARIDQLENMAMNLRLGRGMPTAGELDLIAAEITRAETRLQELLDVAPE